MDHETYNTNEMATLSRSGHFLKHSVIGQISRHKGHCNTRQVSFHVEQCLRPTPPFRPSAAMVWYTSQIYYLSTETVPLRCNAAYSSSTESSPDATLATVLTSESLSSLRAIKRTPCVLRPINEMPSMCSRITTPAVVMIIRSSES